MTPTMKFLLFFAATMSAIAAGQMIGNGLNQVMSSNSRSLEARHREEIQRLRDADLARPERARSDDDRSLPPNGRDESGARRLILVRPPQRQEVSRGPGAFFW